MEKIKELLQNKKILAAVLIVFVCILFAIVFVSNRSEKKSHSKNGIAEASGTDFIKSANIEETNSSEENIEKKTDMELETDEQGNISSVITENGETINLSSDEVETETKADGSGSGANTEATTKAEAADSSSQTEEKSSSDKKEENTAGTKPTTAQSTQPTENVSQKPTTPQPTEPQTSPQPAPEPPTPQPTECRHINITRKVTTAATASSNGAWAAICDTCGSTLETGSIHSYGTHSVDIGGGQTAVVYGYFDDEIADEIFRQLNAYHQENGLPILENRFHEESKVRAVECAYSFAHERPNGEELWDLDELIGGENIASLSGIMVSTETPAVLIATELMQNWKNSYGHNLNMFSEDELGGIGVFVSMTVDSDGIPNREAVYVVQNFGTEY